MKYFIACLLLTLTLPVHAGSIYIGFNIGVLSHGGFILGYEQNQELSVEAHLGGGPHFYTYGIATKIRDTSMGEKYYLIGYSYLKMFGSPAKGDEVSAHGINIGGGEERGYKNDNDKTHPFDGGAFLGIDKNGRFTPNIFIEYGVNRY